MTVAASPKVLTSTKSFTGLGFIGCVFCCQVLGLYLQELDIPCSIGSPALKAPHPRPLLQPALQCKYKGTIKVGEGELCCTICNSDITSPRRTTTQTQHGRKNSFSNRHFERIAGKPFFMLFRPALLLLLLLLAQRNNNDTIDARARTHTTHFHSTHTATLQHRRKL